MKKLLPIAGLLAITLALSSCANLFDPTGENVVALEYNAPAFNGTEKFSLHSLNSGEPDIEQAFLFTSADSGVFIVSVIPDLPASEKDKKCPQYNEGQFAYSEAITFSYNTEMGRIEIDNGGYLQLLEPDGERKGTYVEIPRLAAYYPESGNPGLYQKFICPGINASFTFAANTVEYFDGSTTLKCKYKNEGGNISITKSGYEGSIELKYFENGMLIPYEKYGVWSDLILKSDNTSIGLHQTASGKFNDGTKSSLKDLLDSKLIPSCVKNITIFDDYEEADYEKYAEAIKAHTEFNFEFYLANSTNEEFTDAFKGIENLSGFTVPQKVSDIEDNAFEGCKNFTTFNSLYANVNHIGFNAFKGTKLSSFDAKIVRDYVWHAINSDGSVNDILELAEYAKEENAKIINPKYMEGYELRTYKK